MSDALVFLIGTLIGCFLFNFSCGYVNTIREVQILRG